MHPKKRSGRRKRRTGYAVEKILDKRNNNGVIEYFLKWQNYPDSVNSWEPEEYLNCPDLIKEFETSLQNKKKESNRKLSSFESDSEETSEQEQELEVEEETEEIDPKLVPEEILGITTDSNGELQFVIKWKESDETDLVPSKIANVMCPQLVINFYEQRIGWVDFDSNE